VLRTSSQGHETLGCECASWTKRVMGRATRAQPTNRHTAACRTWSSLIGAKNGRTARTL
jgi:hypothetical protein